VDIPEFEVLFDSGTGNSGDESYGVVIETPNDVDQAVFKLNELLLETRGGTSLIWRGDVLADIDALENADNTSETALKRRPERWDLTVASGIIKARANQSETNVTANPLPDLRRPMLSLNGFFRARLRPAPRLQVGLEGYTEPIIIPQGVNLSFDGTNFTLEPLPDDMGFIGASVFESSVIGTKKQLNQRQVEQLQKTQTLLLLLPNLADTQTAFEYVIEYTLGDNGDDDGSSFEDENSSDEQENPDSNSSSLLEFLLEHGVTVEALSEVVRNDPFIAQVIVNATFNDPNGIESVREVVNESSDLLGIVTLFTTLVDGDEVGVDLLIEASGASTELTQLLSEQLQDNPLLSEQLIDRLTTSPAAFETMLTNAESTPNTMTLLVSIANTDDSPLNLGTELLLQVIDSSESALQNLVLALQDDPDTLAQFEALLADDPTLAGILEQNGVLVVLQQGGLLQPDPTDAPVFVVAQGNTRPVATVAPTLVATQSVATLVATEPQVTQTIDPGVPATATPVPYTPTSKATLTPTDTPTPTVTLTPTDTPTPTSTPAGCPNFAAGGNITMTASCTMDTAATIASNTTIEGGGFTLTASGLGTSGAGRHFLVKAGVTLTINNLTLTGGVVPNSGGSIYNNGSVIISNSTITGNSTTNASTTDLLVGGGALYNNSTGYMSISDTHINNNSTPRLGGGIFNNPGNLVLVNVTFTNNTATADSATNHIQGTYSNEGGGNTFNP